MLLTTAAACRCLLILLIDTRIFLLHILPCSYFFLLCPLYLKMETKPSNNLHQAHFVALLMISWILQLKFLAQLRSQFYANPP